MSLFIILKHLVLVLKLEVKAWVWVWDGADIIGESIQRVWKIIYRYILDRLVRWIDSFLHNFFWHNGTRFYSNRVGFQDIWVFGLGFGVLSLNKFLNLVIQMLLTTGANISSWTNSLRNVSLFCLSQWRSLNLLRLSYQHIDVSQAHLALIFYSQLSLPVIKVVSNLLIHGLHSCSFNLLVHSIHGSFNTKVSRLFISTLKLVNFISFPISDHNTDVLIKHLFEFDSFLEDVPLPFTLQVGSLSLIFNEFKLSLLLHSPSLSHLGCWHLITVIVFALFRHICCWLHKY